MGDPCKEKEAFVRMDVLIKLSIVPPKRLYHPVLPFRANQKLVFFLCQMCVLTCNTEICQHTTDGKRALSGTWVMDKVRLAVE